MGDYTGLRFKGVVKPEFRVEFSRIATTGAWCESDDAVFKSFSACASRCDGIPTGSLDYVPDEWLEDNETGSNGDFRLIYITKILVIGNSNVL